MRKRNLLSAFLLICMGGIFTNLQAQNFPATCGGSIPDNACITPEYDTCTATVSGIGVLGTVNILEKVCVVLPSGVYFLQIENNGERLVERIVKN